MFWVYAISEEAKYRSRELDREAVRPGRLDATATKEPDSRRETRLDIKARREAQQAGNQA